MKGVAEVPVTWAWRNGDLVGVTVPGWLTGVPIALHYYGPGLLPRSAFLGGLAAQPPKNRTLRATLFVSGGLLCVHRPLFVLALLSFVGLESGFNGSGRRGGSRLAPANELRMTQLGGSAGAPRGNPIKPAFDRAT